MAANKKFGPIFKELELAEGKQVVVNQCSDSTIYTIAECKGKAVRLTFKTPPPNCRVQNAGWVNIDSLLKPSPSQLRHAQAAGTL